MTANAVINNNGHNPVFVWEISTMPWVSQMEKECCKRKVNEKINWFWIILLNLLWMN